MLSVDPKAKAVFLDKIEKPETDEGDAKKEQNDTSKDTEVKTEDKKNSDKPLEDENSGNGDKETKKEVKVLKKIGIRNGGTVPKGEFTQYLKDRVATLRAMEKYEGKECLDNIKGISDGYRNRYFKDQAKMCEILISEGFSDVVMKMMDYFNNEGVFKSDDLWFPAYYTYSVCWNYSDASLAMCQDLADKGLLRVVVANIRHQPYLLNMTSKNVFYIIKSSISIIQNISKNPEVKTIFEEHNTLEALKTFTTSSDDFIKTVALMAISNLISEAENAALTDTGAIPFMVKVIDFALKNQKRRYRGFTPEEVTVSLAKLAVNDENKMKIVNVNALPLFLAMLSFNLVDEQRAAAKVLWNLAFDENVRQKIKDLPGLVDALEKLAKNSDDDQVRKSCKGALWVIQEKSKEGAAKMDKSENAVESGKNEEHIFISYNWGSQQMVLKIVEKLKNDGHKVWVDVDQMGGSTLEAMALGIENAKLVVICMSEKYKQSPNCRTEAEYTFQLKKPMLPLMMQRHYKPDGWLGMLLGAKFYINMDGKYTLNQAYPMMIREMGRMSGTAANEQSESASAPTETFHATSAREPTMYHPQVKTLKDPEKVSKWTSKEVADWIKENKLQRVAEKFTKYDGQHIVQLVKMRYEAPEFYYKSLESKMDLDLTDILDLNAAFDTL